MSSEPVDLTCSPMTPSRKRKCHEQPDIEEEDEEVMEQKRLMANSQERLRMQRINAALEDLKHTLPEEYHPSERRMSKIRTLRSAMDYIRGLSELLEEDNIRRQQIYAQTKEYVKAMYGHALLGQSECLYGAGFQSPTQSGFSSLFPYLGPLCSDDGSSYFRTPQQTTPLRQMAPRHLEFNAPRKSRYPETIDTTPTEFIVAGKTNARNPACQFQDQDLSRTPVSSTRHRPCETFSGPFAEIEDTSGSTDGQRMRSVQLFETSCSVADKYTAPS
ncbi:hypothetical protein DPMN_120815 [Dreissena polymorpha]|uniref:BHLH domain-containing protein n=1 Tax=Dreissena polymorpha TaxID=45954 RepID=A0A9D4GKZ5_DREPO|nr:hypothetical protein DPMN_120815 [Dreissena polymorpha]